MRTTIITESDRIQLCLHPESKHDKQVVKVLAEMPNTHRTNLYKRQGGYTAFDSRWNQYDGDVGEDLLIVFDKPESESSDNQDKLGGE